MNKKLPLVMCISSLLFSFSSFAATAQLDLTRNHGEIIQTPKGRLLFPDASNPKLAMTRNGETRAHTNYIIFYPKEKTNTVLPGGETAASLACVYQLTPQITGCNLNNATAVPTGGWGTIAIVDAFDNSYAEADLAVFSTAMGLPAADFTKVYASGSQPVDCAADPDDNWCPEESLDVQWAHAMAPNAKIVLVEATDDSMASMLQAEEVANEHVHVTGGAVSNSWGITEESNETLYDSVFQEYTGILYFASTGDNGATPAGNGSTSYPATSPYVIAAGASSVQRDANDNFLTENAWSFTPNYPQGASAGGPSLYESRPTFQNLIQKIVGTQRGTPDIAFHGDPNTGVDIYDSNDGGWYTGGGTSVASPALAGIINSSTSRTSITTTQDELSKIYLSAAKKYGQNWRDISVGYNGYYGQKTYDFITGLGTPLTYQGK